MLQGPERHAEVLGVTRGAKSAAKQREMEVGGTFDWTAQEKQMQSWDAVMGYHLGIYKKKRNLGWNPNGVPKKQGRSRRRSRGFEVRIRMFVASSQLKMFSGSFPTPLGHSLTKV